MTSSGHTRRRSAQLSAEQRAAVLRELSGQVPPSEVGGDDPKSLARTATRAELRQPGTIERTFGGGALPGLGSMFLSTLAGAFVGSAIADAVFDSNDSAEGSAETGTEATGADETAADGSDGGGGFGGEAGAISAVISAAVISAAVISAAVISADSDPRGQRSAWQRAQRRLRIPDTPSMTDAHDTLTDDLAATVEATRLAERELFGGLDAATRERPIREGDWNPQDFQAHLTAWKSRQADRYAAVREGRQIPAPMEGEEEDALNEELRAARAEWSWDALVEEADAVTERLVGEIRRADPATLRASERLIPGTFGNGVLHALTHFRWLLEAGVPLDGSRVAAFASEADRPRERRGHPGPGSRGRLV